MKDFSLLTSDQLTATDFLEHTDAGVLWADVGTGKTVVAETAAKRLLDRFDRGRFLVVGPQRVARRVWTAESTEWTHLTGLKVRRLTGSVEERLAVLDSIESDDSTQIYTITRDLVPWLERQFIQATQNESGTIKRVQTRRWPFDGLILDECQSFKHQDANRYKSMRRLRRLCRCVWLLTGDFMPNGHKDLWGQMYLVDRGETLGQSERAFRRRWFEKEVVEGVVLYRLRAGAKEEIDRKLAKRVHVLKDTRPEHVRYEFHPVELSKTEQALYRKMVRSSVLEISGKEITAINAGVLYGKLLQIANGAVYDETGAWHEVHTQTIAGILELLESLPRPVLIGYGFRHDVARIQSALSTSGERVATLRTDASLDAWRRGETDIGIIHPATAGHGLNDLYVAGGENLIWFGLTNNREFYNQLNGRLAGGHRRAGKNIVIHHVVTEGTIHDRTRALLDMKGEDQLTAQLRILAEMRRAYE